MNIRRVVSLSAALVLASHADAAQIARSSLDRALQARVGDTVELPLPETREAMISAPVKMRRIEVVAPGAKTYIVDATGTRELPDTGWRHFTADASVPGAPRYGLSISPDGSEAMGTIVGQGARYSISGTIKSEQLILSADARPIADEHGNPIYFECGLGDDGKMDLHDPWSLPSKDGIESLLNKLSPKSASAASRTAAIAVDTDSELLSQKFGDNTTSATNYLNALFVALNTVYERDIDVTIQRGTTFLRVGSDPYASSYPDISDQLGAVGDYWTSSNPDNTTSISRAFVLHLSGKSASNFSSAGIAWIIGANNMCSASDLNGGCASGACTAGHYSTSRVFKFGGSTATDDLLVVAHELGHNFGASHTHCTDTSGTAGVQPIDTCISGAGSGCYTGATSCPTPTTINGVTNVTGTLMSYCHLSGLAGCDSFEVFHPFHENQLRTTATNNVTSGCFTTGGGGTISIADRTSGEATSPMQFTLTRSNSSGAASVVASTAATGTATGGGTDFTNVSSQTVHFADGSTTATLNVTINSDNIDEVDETFVVNLTTPSAGYTISDTQATGTITDDDTSTISVNDPAAVTEGSPVTFTVTLSNPNSRTVTVTRQTANGTASSSSDYTALGAGTVTFTAGDTSENVVVNTSDDNLDEPGAAETFVLNLSGASNATIGDSSGTGSINDNDPTPTMNIADAPAQPENGATVSRFIVSLSNPSQQTVTAQGTTQSGTATNNVDYQARTNANISFAPGETTFNFDVTRNGDTTFEADETFTVQLSSISANASAGDTTASGTILNDDAGPAVSIADASLTEGDASSANMVFTVSIAAAAGANVAVTYSTSPIDATAGADYTAVTGTATITAGNTSTTINVPIVGDAVDEWDEQFNVNIAATSSSTIGDGQAVGTINDNDTGGVPIYRNSFE